MPIILYPIVTWDHTVCGRRGHLPEAPGTAWPFAFKADTADPTVKTFLVNWAKRDALFEPPFDLNLTHVFSAHAVLVDTSYGGARLIDLEFAYDDAIYRRAMYLFRGSPNFEEFCEHDEARLGFQVAGVVAEQVQFGCAGAHLVRAKPSTQCRLDRARNVGGVRRRTPEAPGVATPSDHFGRITITRPGSTGCPSMYTSSSGPR